MEKLNILKKSINILKKYKKEDDLIELSIDEFVIPHAFILKENLDLIDKSYIFENWFFDEKNDCLILNIKNYE